jgi:hypothetical protein
MGIARPARDRCRAFEFSRLSDGLLGRASGTTIDPISELLLRCAELGPN